MWRAVWLRGHKVYATVHRESSINDVRTILASLGDNFVVDKLDVTDASDVNKVDDWDIDVLVNNAAIGDSGPLAEIDLQRVKAVFETNVFSTLRLAQKVVARLIGNGEGRIVFTGSMAGLIPTPFYAPYAMTKFALESLAFSFLPFVEIEGREIVPYETGKEIMRGVLKTKAEA
jgi:short-subunit dehydrogenase